MGVIEIPAKLGDSTSTSRWSSITGGIFQGPNQLSRPVSPNPVISAILTARRKRRVQCQSVASYRTTLVDAGVIVVIEITIKDRAFVVEQHFDDRCVPFILRLDSRSSK